MTPDTSSLSSGSSCLDFELHLAEYAEGSLSAHQHDLVADHLDHCPMCRAELGRELHLRGELGSLPVEECPARVTRNLLTLVEAEEGPASAPIRPRTATWRRINPFLGWAAAAAAAAVLIWAPLQGGSEAERQAEARLATTAPAEYSPQEIKAARADLARSLLLTMQVLDRSERSTVKEVFGRTLPRSLSRSLKTVITPPEGGQG